MSPPKPPALPPYATRFVGREAELSQIDQWFRGGARLVTLTGLPGMGKTRLSLQYARHAGDAFDGGAWFVDLTNATSVGDLCAGVADNLGVLSTPELDPVGRVGHALAAWQNVLLVLDNFERLVGADGPRAVAEWLRRAPRARLLVTSREVLRIDGEHVLELSPLGVPDGAAAEPLDAALSSKAVSLLLERAPGLELSAQNARLVSEIVRGLEGIPLAIELCAPRLVALGPRAVLDKMTQRLDLLARGERDRDARQRTLRGAFDASWELLREAERDALGAASVFGGGFDLPAFERVSGSGWEALQALREKSLVRAVSEGEGGRPARFALYEATRAYALEQLALSGRAPAVERAHAEYFAEEGERRALSVRGEHGEASLAWLEAELENLLIAAERIRTCATPAAVDLRARLVVAAEPVLALRGPFERFGSLLLELARSDLLAAIDPARAARVFRARSRVLRQSGRLAESVEAVLAAIHAAESSGESSLLAELLVDAGEIEQERGGFERARAHHEAALATLADRGDPGARARALGGLGLLHHGQGRLDEAWTAYSSALVEAGRAGDVRLQAGLYKDLGSMRLQQGRLAEARELYARSRELGEPLSDAVLLGVIEANLGLVEQEEGRPEAASALFEAAHRRLSRHGARLLDAHVMGYWGALHHERGDVERAGRLYEDAIAVLREVGDLRNEGLFWAALGAAQSARGRGEAAREAFEHAGTRLASVGDPHLLDALEIHRGHLDLLVARAAQDGDAPAAHEARARAARVAAFASARSKTLSDDGRFALRLLEAALRQGAWTFDAASGTLCPPGGEAIDLASPPQLLRLVTALVHKRLASPGTALTQDDLMAIGWPGERIAPSAAQNRVKVALSTLRSLGLREVLQRVEGGYLIDPAVPFSSTKRRIVGSQRRA